MLRLYDDSTAVAKKRLAGGHNEFICSIIFPTRYARRATNVQLQKGQHDAVLEREKRTPLRRWHYIVLSRYGHKATTIGLRADQTTQPWFVDHFLTPSCCSHAAEVRTTEKKRTIAAKSP